MEQDLVQAVKWYRKAAAQGHVTAQVKLLGKSHDGEDKKMCLLSVKLMMCTENRGAGAPRTSTRGQSKAMCFYPFLWIWVGFVGILSPRKEMPVMLCYPYLLSYLMTLLLKRGVFRQEFEV